MTSARRARPGRQLDGDALTSFIWPRSSAASRTFTASTHAPRGEHRPLQRRFRLRLSKEGMERARPRLLIDGVRKGNGGEIHCRCPRSGEQMRTLRHIDDIADGIVTAMVHPAGENVGFNISASEERMLAEIAQIVWEACGPDPAEFELERLPSFKVDVQRRSTAEERLDLRGRIAGTGRLGLGQQLAARNG